MWLITGPFDCAQTGDEDTLKRKLLKASCVYDFGRHPDSSLWVNNKKISRQHGQLIVGEHSEDDVSNGALVPTLSLRNNRTAALKVERGDTFLLVNPDSTRELESGDVINLTGSIHATVTWESVVCFHTPSDAPGGVDLSACASMGLKLVTKHSRDVTHHLTSSLTAPVMPAMLYTLLTPARFVTSSWIAELIRRGNDDDKGLEKTYEAPLEGGFRPGIDKSLSERYPEMSQKVAWNPNDDRKALFEDMRFVFVVLGSGAGTESKTMADVVSRGGATRQLVNIEKEAEEQARGASGTWGTVLRKRKVILKEGMGSGLVLVGEEETMTARGVPKEVKDAWETIVESAQSVNMRIVPPSLISEAIFKADVSVLDCVLKEDASKSQGTSALKALPDHIPSTHPEESSQLPPSTRSRQASAEASQTSGAGPSRRLTRRATSQTPAPEPAPPVVPMEVEEEPAAAPPPRKLLKRRAKTANPAGLVNKLLGIDDSTVILDEAESQSPSQFSQPQSQEQVLQGLVPPTPARPSRLKRRAGTAAATAELFSDPSVRQEDEEPPHKKFKALFEQSGQGTIQPDAASGSQLYAVREEEEEPSQSQAPTQTQGKKRKAVALGDDTDVEMQAAEEPAAPKRRAIEAVNAVEPSHRPKPPSSKPASKAAKTAAEKKTKSEKKASGAAPGKPDTDPSFLQAIASTKRGKKTEDDFDREFNKLKITRPDINNKGGSTNSAVEWAKEWEGLDNFEKDVGIRGNFMQIVEMEVWRDSQNPEQRSRNLRREEGLGARIDWDGRQDFKKFKRKQRPGERVTIELVANESQDHPSGPSYWESRGGNKPRGFDEMSQSQEHDSSHVATRVKSRPKSQPKPKPRMKTEVETFDDQDDDEVEEVIGKVASKGKGKAARTGKRVQALFEPDSDDEDVVTESAFRAEEEDLDLTLQSDKSQKEKARGTKRKAAVAEESDSEDGANFRGFAKKAKKIKR